MEQRKPGEKRRIYISNTLIEVEAVEVIRIETESLKGWLESYNIEDYGLTQHYWWEDGLILGEQAAQRRSRSMMPPEYVYKSARDFDWTLYNENVDSQKAVANAFILNFDSFQKEGRGLFIFSSAKGSGKTFLACILGNEIIKRRDLSVKFITVPDYIELIKSTHEQDKDIVKAIQDCSLLILDDIGAESSSKDWIQSAVFRLIDYRDRDLLPTIYTSNYSMEDLPGDERTVNRIIGHSIPLPMPQQSIRKEQAQERTGEFVKEILSDKQGDIFTDDGEEN